MSWAAFQEFRGTGSAFLGDFRNKDSISGVLGKRVSVSGVLGNRGSILADLTDLDVTSISKGLGTRQHFMNFREQRQSFCCHG